MTAQMARPILPRSRLVLTVLAWAWVIAPFLYGLCQLVIKIPALFGG
jgi:hypothetical protein